jgi:uncharacterized protein
MLEQPAPQSKPVSGWLPFVIIGMFLICWASAKFLPLQPKTLLELFVFYYTWYWLPPLVVLLVIFRRDALCVWGFTRAPLQSLGVAFVMALPALIGFLVTSAPNALTSVQIMSRAVMPGFFEEALFRGFLFGVLFKRARWGFVPASLIAALVFGIGHLYQGNDLMSAFGAFAVTALGSLWFSWLLVAWDSLWVPIGLHILLNLYWELFTNDQTAVGDGLSNLFRGLVIALSIVLTLRLRRSAIVQRSELWTRPV